MRFEKHHLLYFGSITVLIEWIALIVGISYMNDFNPDNALSVATVAAQPLPTIFGIATTTVAITYSLFAIPLHAYDKRIPYLAVLAGIGFTATGWIPFTGQGGAVDTIHNISSFVAVAGYTGIIWLLRKHPKAHVSKASTLAYRLLIVAVIISYINTYVVHRYIAYGQLYVLGLIQAWTVFIVWHERKLVDGA